jgi:hypothetical protein
MNEDDVKCFLASRQAVFKRAIAELGQLVGFHRRLGLICGSFVGQIDSARVKDVR